MTDIPVQWNRIELVNSVSHPAGKGSVCTATRRPETEFPSFRSDVLPRVVRLGAVPFPNRADSNTSAQAEDDVIKFGFCE